MKMTDYTNQRAGHLTVKRRGEDKQFTSSRQVQWYCECVCGREVLVTTTRLRQNTSNLSCGCLNWTSSHGNSKHSPKGASFLGLYNRSKQSARKRGLEWGLEFEEFAALVVLPCIWCHEPPFTPYNAALAQNGYSQTKHVTPRMLNGDILVNGLDRVDNLKGYVPSNVQPCCKYCNFARNDRSRGEFLTWLKNLANIYGEG